MKKMAIFFLLSLINFQVFAQKIVREYWDYYHKKLRSEYHTTNDGFRNGPYKEWYSNGILKVKGNMKNDSKEGWTYWYTERGALYLEKLWQQDALIQEKEHWEIPGTPVRTICWYIDGRRSEFKEFGENGKLKIWSKNRQWTILYFENGKKRAYIPININDQDDYGNAVFYSEDGSIIDTDLGDR